MTENPEKMNTRVIKKTVLALGCATSLFMLGGCAMTDGLYMPANDEIRHYDESTWESNEAVMRAAESAGDYRLALMTGKDFIARHPDHVDARVMTARLMTRTGDAQQALRTLDFIPVAERTDASNMEKARALMTLGSAEKALELLEAMPEAKTDAMPTDKTRNVKKLLAVALSMNGKLDEAATVFESLMSQSDEPEVRYNYARTELYAGRSQHAYDLLAPIVNTFEPAKTAAAMALWRLGREDECRALLSGLVKAEAFDAWIKEHGLRDVPAEH